MSTTPRVVTIRLPGHRAVRRARALVAAAAVAFSVGVSPETGRTAAPPPASPPPLLLAVSAAPGPPPDWQPHGLLGAETPDRDADLPGPVVGVLSGRAPAAGIPVRVLAAYRFAADRMAQTQPRCGLPWWLLAGIGRIESAHASGGRVDDDGRTRGPILGPRLDGSLAGTRVITDSDGGALDLDAAYDRAVGPMQFLPGTWRAFGRDGDGDGAADPHDVDDAALAAAVYLCARGDDLTTEAGMAAAVLRYNASAAYVRSVLGWAYAYRDGAAPVPGDAGVVLVAADVPVAEPSPSTSVTVIPTAPVVTPTAEPAPPSVPP
ncbi:MAG: lytic transglycosylase domain-containing protein, partial [Actinomycetota bacterium]